jgi:hypothetical protein
VAQTRVVYRYRSKKGWVFSLRGGAGFEVAGYFEFDGEWRYREGSGPQPSYYWILMHSLR